MAKWKSRNGFKSGVDSESWSNTETMSPEGLPGSQEATWWYKNHSYECCLLDLLVRAKGPCGKRTLGDRVRCIRGVTAESYWRLT